MSQDWWRNVRAAETAFFLDVDGTLLGFEDRPEDVVADAELLGLLERLRALSGGALALVSGRMVSDLDRIMAPFLLPAGGVHGAEMRYADGQREAFEGAALAEVRAEVDAFVAAHPGLRVEEKGTTTFAVHFRQAPALADAVADFLDTAVEGHDLMVQHGKMVAEVKPGGCHKGLAIEALMRTRPFARRTPFFMGDDLTDEHGFEAVNNDGGISVKVGGSAETTIAQHRVADVTAARDLLGDICRLAEGTK